MSSTRIRGEDTAVFITDNGVLLDTLTDITDCEVTFEFEIKEENFLGQTAPQFDEIFKGASVKIGYQFSDAAPFALMQSVLARAQRRTPGVKINVQTSLNFPSGIRKRILLPDCSSGPMPFNNSGRAEFLKGTLDFKVSNPKVV